MWRMLVMLGAAALLAACGGGSDGRSDGGSAAEPVTTLAPTTSAPPATLAPDTTASVPARARQLQTRLRRDFKQVRSVREASNTVTIDTGYIFNDHNALAAVEICEAAKAALADASFVEVMAVDDRWLARTTVFTGRCKATTLLR